MKLQVTQENLNRALANVARVANSRGTLPILANILLKTTGNRLSIAATNLNIAITHYVGTKISEKGTITVPARLMQDFVNSLPGGIIELELEDSKLHLNTKQYQSVINGTPADEFPVMPAITDGKMLKIPASVLHRALQQVIFAASNDEARPVLTGVMIHNVEDHLYMVATDSYRLAESRLQTSTNTPELLVPATALQDLLRILGDYEGDVRVTYDEQQVLFKVGDVELVARLIEGKYPPYRQLIPSKFSTVATVPRSELLNITKVSSLFARESAGSITIKVDETDKTISIHSIASQLGENTASTVGKVKGSASITLNSRYLLDGLNALKGEEVSFCFNGKLEPSVLKDPSSNDYVHIIMPLKS